MAKYDRDTSFDNYFLLGDAYKQNDVIVSSVTHDEKWESCRLSCENCRVCKSVNPFRQQCWRHCDRCRYCNFRGHLTTKTHDLPYYNRHPYTPDPDDTLFTASNLATPRVCGPVAYAKFIDQYNDYVHCKQCQRAGKCWSKYQEKCIECSDEQLAVSCERKFGCPNPNGPLFAYGPPRNPVYTDCRMCWNTGYNTLV